jgi:hypothetical protein
MIQDVRPLPLLLSVAEQAARSIAASADAFVLKLQALSPTSFGSCVREIVLDTETTGLDPLNGTDTAQQTWRFARR